MNKEESIKAYERLLKYFFENKQFYNFFTDKERLIKFGDMIAMARMCGMDIDVINELWDFALNTFSTSKWNEICQNK